MSAGVSEYIFGVDDDGDKLVATYRSRNTDKAKLYNLSNLSEMMLIDNALDQMVNKMAGTLDLIASGAPADSSTTTAVSGGYNRSTITPGSRTEIDTYHLIVSLDHVRRVGVNVLGVSGFLDAAWGDYSASDKGRFGDGDASSLCGGVAAFYAFENGFAIDGSVRAGAVQHDMGSNNLGRGTSYDSPWSPYFGAHLGV